MEQYIYERYFQEVTRSDFHQSGLLLQYARERQTTPHLLWQSFAQHIQKYNLDNTLANLIEYLNVAAKQSDGKLANYIYVNNVATSNYSNDIVNNKSQEVIGMISSQGFDNNASNQNNYKVVAKAINNEYATQMSGNHQDYDFLNNNGDNYDVLHGRIGNHVFVGDNVGIDQNINVPSSTSMIPYQNANDIFKISCYEDTNVVYNRFERSAAYTHADFSRVKREAEEVFEKKLEEEERKKFEEDNKKEVLRNIHDMLK